MAAVIENYTEAVELGAVDSTLYSQFWFPKDCRQDSPQFHEDLWKLFEDNRFANCEIFRGGAKTTIARLFASKRIAYGLSHTILFVGPNQGHAAESVAWIMQQVEYNTEWAQAFGLKKGKKWTATNCEIVHEKFAYPIRLMAIGITGAIRGINIGGHRPDLIIVDDPCDEENTATPEQRVKIADLFFQAIKEALVPRSEDPLSGLILLQTPLHEDDLSALCMKSDEFASIRVSIMIDPHTGDTCLDEKRAISAWPARWSKEEILAEKQSAVQRNQLSGWMREKMCLLTARETSAFREEWLKLYEILPATARYVMAIDPAPIMSDKARSLGTRTDLQAVMVKCYWKAHRFVVDYHTARDEDPDELAGHINRFARKYPILRCGVEGVAYQRTLKWFIEREMRSGRLKSLNVVELPAIGNKYTRIIQAHSGPASQGLLHIKAEHTEFLEQFVSYPNTKFKDLLDVSAMCDATINPREAGMIPHDSLAYVDEGDVEELDWERPAP